MLVCPSAYKNNMKACRWIFPLPFTNSQHSAGASWSSVGSHSKPLFQVIILVSSILDAIIYSMADVLYHSSGLQQQLKVGSSHCFWINYHYSSHLALFFLCTAAARHSYFQTWLKATLKAAFLYVLDIDFSTGISKQMTLINII